MEHAERLVVSRSSAVVLGVLAVVFAAGLAFASVELPRVASGWLMEVVDFPGFDSGREAERADAFIQSHGLRVVGYASLLLVAAAVVAGLLTGRRALAAAGAVALFLPVFGHFAASMFFLAGLGMFRVIFLPVLDRSHDLMALGEVAFVPYMAAVYPPALLGFDARDLVVWGTMTVGMAVFILGVYSWFLTRARGSGVADSWVYRISRHPQYLGWILWSYGLLLYVSRYSELYHFKISYGVPSSLPWLLSTMVIVGVALAEEVAMDRRYGESYRSFAARTPFLLPTPRWLARLVEAPMRLVLGGRRPRSGADVLRVVFIYTLVLILASVPFVVFDWPAVTAWYAFPYNVPPFTS
jgi:protein-S-isoprenylcysteine O-methyltransferase Ste14